MKNYYIHPGTWSYDSNRNLLPLSPLKQQNTSQPLHGGGGEVLIMQVRPWANSGHQEMKSYQAVQWIKKKQTETKSKQIYSLFDTGVLVCPLARLQLLVCKAEKDASRFKNNILKLSE